MLFIGDQIVTMLRDDDPSIPFPNMWDFPGGGREDGEVPETCVLRETLEELSLAIKPDELIWKSAFPSPVVEGTVSYWFAACLPKQRQHDIVLGDEGQCWALMTPQQWCEDDRAIPHFKPRLQAAVAALQGHGIENTVKRPHISF